MMSASVLQECPVMASIQKKGDSFYCQFVFQGRRRTITIGKVSRAGAESFATRTEELLALIARGRITLPSRVAITDFVLHDGKPHDSPQAPPAVQISFRQFKDRYLNTHGGGVMEANSLATVGMHLRHFERTLGARFVLSSLTLADLQRHVAERAKTRYRGRPLSPVTLRKEVASFRAAWNWAALTGLVSGSFPSKGLVYPKADEKQPFMSLQEVEQRLASGAAEKDRAELWDCLYLTRTELDDLLWHVKEHAGHAWVYPMFCFAAHTGARRSEMLRALVADVDFAGKTVLLHEKKRSRKQRTTRRVPLTPFLEGVLKEWLAIHPGGPHLFCHLTEVARSKKRSRTTGHRGERTRASSLKGRMATVTRRATPAAGPITRDEAHDHLKRTLACNKWEVLRGYHVLRHSFISACASKGIDQRLIDEWTGHSTEEQRKRYRHLYPSTQQEAINRVFG
jgi:integrase